MSRCFCCSYKHLFATIGFDIDINAQNISQYNWTNAHPSGSTKYLAVFLADDAYSLNIASETEYMYGSFDLSDESSFVINSFYYGDQGYRLWIDVAGSLYGTCLVAATQQSGGSVWTSSDFGFSWKQAIHVNRDFKCVASSEYGDILMAASFSGMFGSGDIWVSFNAGANWTLSSTGNQAYVSCTMDQYGTVMLVADRGWNTGGVGYIYRSVDGGATFNQTNSAQLTWMVVDCNAMCDIAVAIDNSGSSEIWLSVDIGDSWVSLIAATGGITWSSVAISSISNLIVASQYESTLWTSTDLGQSWVGV